MLIYILRFFALAYAFIYVYDGSADADVGGMVIGILIFIAGVVAFW